MVCDETENTKHRRLQQDVRSSFNLARLEVHLSLGYCDEDVAVWQFYSIIMASLSRSDHAYYLYSELPKLYTRSYNGSALRLSTQAIAHAHASKYRGSRIRYAQKLYTQAISAMNLALQDSKESIADEMLYAVLLLCGYETITCGSKMLAGWTAHVSGVAAMLIYRSKQSLTQPFTSKLYHFARRSIVLYHIQSCTSIAPLFSGIEGTSPPDENDEDRLFSLMAILPEIQHSLKCLLIGPTVGHGADVQDFLSNANALDSRLQDWENNLPPTWAFNTAQNLQSLRCTEPGGRYVPDKLHKYQDMYTARLWNLYRVSRVILYSIIIHFLISIAVNTSSIQPDIELDAVQAKILAFVNDICASVMFLSGKDLSKMRLSDLDHSSANAGKDQLETYTNQSQDRNGRYSLLWPLYVASSVTFAPESQRRWMRQQILSIGEAGEPLAVWLVDSQSQSLVGGSEAFAFDCV
jgi:hypothetical protein